MIILYKSISVCQPFFTNFPDKGRSTAAKQASTIFPSSSSAARGSQTTIKGNVFHAVQMVSLRITVLTVVTARPETIITIRSWGSFL